jgi:hypothetical protein
MLIAGRNCEGKEFLLIKKIKENRFPLTCPEEGCNKEILPFELERILKK